MFFQFRVPEVPSLHEVAFIDVTFRDDDSNSIREVIGGLCEISDRPPVHISDIEERPGALLVKWEEVATFHTCYGNSF